MASITISLLDQKDVNLPSKSVCPLINLLKAQLCLLYSLHLAPRANILLCVMLHFSVVYFSLTFLMVHTLPVSLQTHKPLTFH